MARVVLEEVIDNRGLEFSVLAVAEDNSCSLFSTASFDEALDKCAELREAYCEDDTDLFVKSLHGEIYEVNYIDVDRNSDTEWHLTALELERWIVNDDWEQRNFHVHFENLCFWLETNEVGSETRIFIRDLRDDSSLQIPFEESYDTTSEAIADLRKMLKEFGENIISLADKPCYVTQD